MRRTAMPLAVAAAVLGLAGDGGADEAYRATVKKWRDERQARLKADGGWLSVAGLAWLKPGENRFGTDKTAAVVLPAGSAPPLAGVFELKGTETTVRLAEGTQARMAGLPLVGPAVLRPDSGDVVELGSVSLQVIERGGRFGIRLKDKNAAARREFTGCRWYEVKEGYRIEAKWVPHPEPRPLKVPNILGQTESMPSPGYAEFKVAGTTVRLDGVLETPQSTQLWFILRDQTSGKDTYPAGRFLYAELPKDGRVVLDFNRAYNPPCAFTAYATCPLPPPQNWLAVKIEAGELNYGTHR
ncbi:MAG TPA: DUF1684 domain-containing protein [Vicinamibacteria bacterium]|nr:DUF1684 domain-containing protein [Vicinamibacteria bacterium]